MAKYSYEFKKQLVSEYLDNQGSYASISQKHGMLDSCQLRKWVAAYKIPFHKNMACWTVAS